MRGSFSSRVSKVIEQSDIVLEIIDARFPAETRNPALERKVTEAGKKLIIVANKYDLVGLERAKRIKHGIGSEFPCIFVSAPLHEGKKKIMEEIEKTSNGKKVLIGVVGYPNTGKSSIINLLCGRKAALTSRKAGFTRGEQFVRISEKILLIDSPGVIPAADKDEFMLFLVGAKNPQDIGDKELTAIKLIEFLSKENPLALEKRYSIGKFASAEAALEQIAIKRNRLKKGGLPDTFAASLVVLEDWSRNILRYSK